MTVLVKNMKNLIIVFSDGETYEGLGDQYVLSITDEGVEELDAGADPNDLDKKDIISSKSLEEYFSELSEEVS